MTNPTYINVAVALPINRLFTYKVSQELLPLISPGKRVLVPFGRRRITGYVIELGEDPDIETVRFIIDVLDEKPLFPESMIPFFKWIADYYIYPIGEVIKCALPGGLNIYDFTSIEITEAGMAGVSGGGFLTDSEEQVLQRLVKGPRLMKDVFKDIGRECPGSLQSAMIRKGLIKSRRILKNSRIRPNIERYAVWRGNHVPVEKRSKQKDKIIELLKKDREISLKSLKAIVPSAARIVKTMADAGYVTIVNRRVYRDPFGETVQADRILRLTGEQERVVANIIRVLGTGFSAHLLTGVTGSGKTEVYLQLASRAVQKGYSVLVLVPEIALISQMEKRFRARFGDCVAVLHSGLSDGERYDQWMRIVSKEATITVGARSAVFAPFENIGLIIVDEEHDPSYKQESSLRYNARDLAVVRAKQASGVVLLGSATPSIQSYYNTTTDKFNEETLTERIEKRPLAEVGIVDLREYRDHRGAKKIITPQLQNAMKEVLERGEQALLFLNRRGFSSFSVCASCGESIRCRNCDISLTFHKGDNVHKCHYCGFAQPTISTCAVCGSSSIQLLGVGTQKVESAVRSLFPEARIARMDRDTTTRKGSIFSILKALKHQEIDVLIGTQMVAKGHDFPNITLVGIICADLSLNFPDFRSGERTFQLLAQVAGRAGRGASPGRVILQTYTPDHFTILTAKEQDFKAFYRKEIQHRRTLNYPPFSRIIQIGISGKDAEKTKKYAQDLGVVCNRLRKKSGSVYNSLEILGPIEASVKRISRQYRWHILVKGIAGSKLHQFVRLLFKDGQFKPGPGDVQVIIDVDPFNMM